MVQPFLKHYPAERSRLSEILEAILEFGAKVGLDNIAMNHLRLISEEIIVNIMDYSYGADNGDIQLEIKPYRDIGITATITSGGTLFNPLNAPKPDTDRPLNEREPGGLGIFLATTLSQHIAYECKKGKNVLTFTVAKGGKLE